MPIMNRDQWDGSDAWREVVASSMHERFLEALADADRDGTPVQRVVVAGGVPMMYDVSQ